MYKLSEFSIPRGFRGRSGLVVQLWWIVDSLLFRPSPQIFYKWRVFLLRLFGAKIGKNVIIRPTVKVTYPWKVQIGDYSWVGDDVVLYSLGNIFIGNNSIISQKSYICAGSHEYMKESFDITQEDISIGNSSWLATDVFVAPGVVIGDNTVIGARSSVFSDIPSNSICIGSPATKVRNKD
ncbi:putative colanic acid biosynthesis acetyltransferase [Raoultella ornithinolytica]|uniref:putative colanic acid biosynthesis acetyltransferase n=1 Tax=Raoultella ornithinolytica TaxID=54291 RepID=UPI000F7022F8|nr:putative colanic acid biosynthesis acetyltransferase [Raoultella ornithinolytica]MDH7608857.1 putative colanic acid biosynthesis acetyltransferase [Raoultella ornithinolytica]VEB69404.1 galactoside O-acetyltransferase [Raoultella ornithinolytica]HDH7847170.1 colanic acid biosynthesis acetyltransferase WcaF [Raoultella ornithinolytica]